MKLFRPIPWRPIAIGALLIPGLLRAGISRRDDGDRVPLASNVPAGVAGARDLGPANPDRRMDRVILLLARRAGGEADLARLLDDQTNPASPDFHRWLTPDEFGERFGLSDADIGRIVDWLVARGFTVDEVARGRGWINFSGTVGQIERAFATKIRKFDLEGDVRHSNVVDPTLPRGLAGLVRGIVSLNDIPRRPLTTSRREVTPQYNKGSFTHYLAPADFATIYDVSPLYSAGTDGSGVSIAVVGRTDINLADVEYFRSFFGLPANDPVVIHNGPAPGDLGGNEETEADLDVEWSGAVAPKATIRFVVSASTGSSDGVDLSAQYIVDHDVAPIATESFGGCEPQSGLAAAIFYNDLWAQAAAEGISAFISEGDNGADDCGDGSGPAVNVLATTPYDVSVGGTEFSEGSDPSLYWASTNDPVTQASAKSYIPEVPWNESIGATGGGVSQFQGKPQWQACAGVPADGMRDVPDVSLSAATHDGYLIVQGHTASSPGLFSVGGTSASTPSFAGLMALVVQKSGEPQGNPNPVFYQLGRDQYAGTGAAVFHDVTSGNNSFDGVTGYACGTGYDPVTGLGSVDAAELVGHWAPMAYPDFELTSGDAGDFLLAPGSTAQMHVSVRAMNGFSSSVALSVPDSSGGVAASFNPATIAAGQQSAVTVSVGAGVTARGVDAGAVVLSASGGGRTHSVRIPVTVTAPVSSSVTTFSSGSAGSFPQGIAAGPDGALWFAEINTNKIARVTTAGALTEYPVPTPGAGPNEIVRGPDGALWFTEFNANKIGRLSTGGAFQEYVIPTPSSQPYAICAGPDGALWFTELNSNKIGRVTTSGVFTEFNVPTPSSEPNFIAAGPDGKIWFTEFATNQVASVTTGGFFAEYLVPTASSYPQGITAGPDGAVWFVEGVGNNVGRVTTTGQITEFPIPSVGSSPNGIVKGSDGALWFTEENTNTIGRVTASGQFREFAIPPGNVNTFPYDIVSGPDGNPWFTLANAGKVGVFDLSSNGGSHRTGANVGPVQRPAPAPVHDRAR